jgi:hypothetical protein
LITREKTLQVHFRAFSPVKNCRFEKPEHKRILGQPNNRSVKMQIKTLMIAMALTVLPTLGFAMGCSHGKEKQTMSCGAGSSYDTTTHSCLPVST